MLTKQPIALFLWLLFAGITPQHSSFVANVKSENNPRDGGAVHLLNGIEAFSAANQLFCS
jgi:hypothetical protein